MSRRVRVLLLGLSSILGLILIFLSPTNTVIYPHELKSKNLSKIQEIDQFKECNRKLAIIEYEKLLRVETDLISRNYIRFMLRSLAYVHNQYSIDSIKLDATYESSNDNLTKILLHTDSLLHANFDIYKDPDLYSKVVLDFSIIENIYFYAIGLYYKYDQPNDKNALEYFNKSIDSYNIYSQNRIFGILANKEAIQNAFNDREYLSAHAYGENAFNLSLQCPIDSITRAIGLVAKGYGIHTENIDKCLDDLKAAKEYCINRDAIVANQEILKLLTYYNFERDSIEYVKYKTEYIQNAIKYGDYMNINRSLGYYLLMDGKYAEAISYYTNSLKFYNGKKRNDPTLLLTAHLFLSDAYKGLGEFDKALNERLLGYKFNILKPLNLSSLLNTINDSLLSVNPTINYILGYDISEILTSKYEKTKDISDLDLALEFMEISLKFKYNPIMSLDKTKELIVYDEYAQYYTKKAIPLIFKLFSLSKNQKYLNKYLELISNNRAKLSNQQSIEASSKFKIPTKFIQKEKYLNSRLSMSKLKQKFDNDSLKYWVEELKTIYDLYQLNFPEYICYLQQDNTKSISYFMSILKKNEGIVQFDIIENDIYIFYIGYNGANLIKRPYNKEEIIQIQEYQTGFKKLDEAYYSTSYYVYQKLIPKDIQNAKRIFIIPDDDLHRLSFDGLCIFHNNTLSITKHEFIFLLNIDRFLVPIEEKIILKQNTALFAFSDPSTLKSKSYNTIPELAGTFKEVKNIASKHNLSNTYFGSEANVDRFKLVYQNPDFQHIHLAVHGFADENKYGLACLLFRNLKYSKTRIDTLYTYDIEAMSSSCKTFVLSACQTHYGKILTQEGNMTIARSFLINGANQVLSTLWPIDDIATARIMDFIYKPNQPINSRTLYKAKLQMYNTGKYTLEQWAGFQLIR